MVVGGVIMVIMVWSWCDHGVMGDVVVSEHLHEARDESSLGHHHAQLPKLVGIQLKASP